MDGTVLDTEPLHALAFGEALKRLDIKDEVNFLGRCIGLNSVAMKKLFVGEVGDEREFDRLSDLAWGLAREYKNERGVEAKSGFIALSDYLLKKNIKSYIVTSTPREPAMSDLKRAGVDGRFEGFICWEDYSRGKPDPEPYLTALRRSGENASDCIAVEDSATGLISATAAGLRCVLIRDTALIPPETAKLAHVELKSLNDIIELINGAIRKL